MGVRVPGLPSLLAGLLAGAALAAAAAWLIAGRTRRREAAGRSALAHDLRTPLSSITAYAEILMDDPEQSARYLPVIHAESERMAGMIDRWSAAAAQPAAAAPQVPTPAASSATPRTPLAAGPPRRVLVVDDDRYIVEATRALLTRAGFQAAGADSAHEALREARVRPPDLILMDLRMPGLAGDEALRRLRADPATRDIPVILTTGEAQAGLPEGAAAVLVKPIPREVLLDAVARAMPPARPGEGANG